MTGERLYENTLAMLTAYEAVSGDQFAKAVIAHPETNCDFKKVLTEAQKDGETLRLPTIRELKEFNIAQKRELGKSSMPHYRVDDCLWVNPYYLIDVLDALPGCVAYKPDNPTDLIYFKAENGVGLLCTVRPPENENNVDDSTFQGLSRPAHIFDQRSERR